MTQIEQIRQEIERRKGELHNDKYINIDAKACRINELNHIIHFLDTLEQQEPEGLDEAALKSAQEWKDNTKEMFIAPYMRGFKAGAEWAFGQFEPMGTFPIEDERGGYWPTEYFVRKK